MPQSIFNDGATNQTGVPVEEIDLLVVGGGKTDESLVMLRVKAGGKVVIVERDEVGGACINVACIPTKTLISATRVLHEVQGLQAYGVTLPGQDGGADALAQVRVELASLRTRKEAVVDGMMAAHEKMFPASGMGFVRGITHFVGGRTVEIALNDDGLWRVRDAKVLINTGTTSSVLPIEGLSGVRYWTSENLLTLPELPSSLIVLGGGVIGVEMVSPMGLLGVSVAIVHTGPHILDRENEDVAAEMTASLEALGVAVLIGAHVSKAAAAADGNDVVVTTADGREVNGSHLLIALGRISITAGLDLKTTDVELTERGFVHVDDHLRVTAENVYAAGDVAGTPQFTHTSWNDFRVLRDLFASREAPTIGRLIPWVVFATPELGHVSMSEAETRKAGYGVHVAKTPTAAVPRARALSHTEGFFKVVINAPAGLILGVTTIGAEASEVVTSIQMAMLGDLTWQQVRGAVITRPTIGKGLSIVLGSLG